MKRAGLIVAIVMVAATMVCVPARAQMQAQSDTTNPVANALRTSMTRYARIMPAAADAMPADKFAYHPTPEQMTYGHLIMHIAESNVNLCAAISGTPRAQLGQLVETDAKDKLVGAIKASFDYCATALASADDSKLGETVTIGNRSLTRAQAMMTLAIDWADHYSTQASYLRMNGVTPPSAMGRAQQPAKQP